MTVAQILKAKGRDVYATRPDHTLLQAARILAEKRVGAVVASDDEMHVLGILSERDIIRPSPPAVPRRSKVRSPII